MGEAALFKASSDAVTRAGAKAEAQANAEAAWHALSVGDQQDAARVSHSAARTAKQAAAAARNAKRAAAAAAAAAPTEPPQPGAPGTPLPSADRLCVLCATLRRAATTTRPRARASPAAATLVVSKGAYREATGALRRWWP